MINRYLLIYFIVIFFILLVTIKNHKKQNIEHYTEHFKSRNNFLRFKNKHIKYSDCKDKCYTKFDDPDKIKTCKSYCKCKKKCNSKLKSSKCLKKCKNIKENLYRDDKIKMEKINLKKELKNDKRNEKKENKINELKEQKKKQKEINKKNENKGSYLNHLINTYFSENDRMYIVDLNKNTNTFFKDVKNIFKF